MYKSKGETCITECNLKHGYVIKQFRPRKHAEAMLKSFRTLYGSEFKIGKGRSRDKRSVHYFRKSVA